MRPDLVDELFVADSSVLISVKPLNQALQVVVACVDAIIVEFLFELLNREVPLVIFIKGFEGITGIKVRSFGEFLSENFPCDLAIKMKVQQFLVKASCFK